MDTILAECRNYPQLPPLPANHAKIPPKDICLRFIGAIETRNLNDEETRKGTPGEMFEITPNGEPSDFWSDFRLGRRDFELCASRGLGRGIGP